MRRRCDWLGFGSRAVLEPPARIASLDDVAVMCQPIEHGGRHFGVTKHGMLPLFLIG
jgi:hypothetical protein